MSFARMKKEDFSGATREELEIRLRQCLNDLRLSKDEARENSLKYMELVGELGERNVELQSLKDGLEEILKARNAEMLLLREQGEERDAVFDKSFRDLEEALRSSCDELALLLGDAFEFSAKLPDEISAKDVSVAASVLPSLLRHLAEGLLEACGKGSRLELSAASAEAGLAIRLLACGDGVNASKLKKVLASCSAPCGSWRGFAGFLRILTGWSVKQDASGKGFLISVGRVD